MNEPNPEEIVFAAARQLPPADRASYLDQACGDNGSLRRRVEALLNASEQSGAWLEISAVPTLRRTPAASIPLAEKPGDKVGRYKLLQQIGEGGCGVVYMAEQEEPVRRRVALKIIKLGMDTRQVIARFEAERQALAMMDHPNIAKVFDASATETGRPYFVMELVRGIRITDYCDQNNLSTRERLNLFTQVCNAIQHAHEKGIIHRDIKPSNILVTMHDGVPVPKVIDFGIAKATEQRLTDKTLFTAFEQFMGTPAYMSPEQAEMSGLGIDARSDIYALGVLLYELLTGNTPFDAKELLQAGLDEMRRTIREKEPARPSTCLSTMQAADLTMVAKHRQADPSKLTHLLHGDLDLIVMKALEKDRAHRYETANGLARDIERHLNNEPVVACPPNVMYRCQKFIRRNRLAFAAGTAVVLTALIGLGFSTWMYLKQRDAYRLAASVEQEKTPLREKSGLDRQQVEIRQKLKDMYGLIRLNQFVETNGMDQADRLIATIPVRDIPPGHIPLLHRLGEWNAVNVRWKQAVERYTYTVATNQEESDAGFARDYLCLAAALLEGGDVSGYERARESAVARFAKTTNSLTAERIIKVALLMPPSSKLLEALQPLAEFLEKHVPSAQFTNVAGDTILSAARTQEALDYNAWLASTSALWEYRCGNYADAEIWCERSIACTSDDISQPVNLQPLLAMTHFRLGKTNLARSELTQARINIEDQFHQTLPRSNWQNWIIARILLHEAQALIEGVPEAKSQTK
ncbi:MAG TPA: serine/threonine-protein kinase [Verrucomicrobiae bacterium]